MSRSSPSDLFTPVRVQQVLPDECVRCSLATLFGLQREDVPHFHRENEGRWFAGLEPWLAERGLKYELWAASLTPPCEWYLGYGESAPGVGHMVVMRNGEIWHDPLGCGILRFESWVTLHWVNAQADTRHE